jgi:hypothetical protein
MPASYLHGSDSLRVMDLLLATDAETINGALSDGNTTRRNKANIPLW